MTNAPKSLRKGDQLRLFVKPHIRTTPSGRITLVRGHNRIVYRLDDRQRLYYASGANHPGEIMGYFYAGQPIGVSARHVSDEAVAILSTIPTIPVFVDSGAFSEIDRRTGSVANPMTDSDWSRVLAVYEQVVQREGPTAVVAPDAVGQQELTLERMRRYAPRIQALVDGGAEVLVPLQAGSMSLSEFWFACQKALGLSDDELTPAIPSNKKAAPTDEVARFLKDHEPDRLHLLGLGPNTRTKAGKAMLDLVEELSPSTKVSLDSNFMQSKVGRSNGPGKSPRLGTRMFDAAGWLAGDDVANRKMMQYALTRALSKGVRFVLDLSKAEQLGLFDVKAHSRVSKSGKVTQVKQHTRKGQATPSLGGLNRDAFFPRTKRQLGLPSNVPQTTEWRRLLGMGRKPPALTRPSSAGPEASASAIRKAIELRNADATREFMADQKKWKDGNDLTAEEFATGKEHWGVRAQYGVVGKQLYASTAADILKAHQGTPAAWTKRMLKAMRSTHAKVISQSVQAGDGSTSKASYVFPVKDLEMLGYAWELYSRSGRDGLTTKEAKWWADNMQHIVDRVHAPVVAGELRRREEAKRGALHNQLLDEFPGWEVRSQLGGMGLVTATLPDQTQEAMRAKDEKENPAPSDADEFLEWVLEQPEDGVVEREVERFKFKLAQAGYVEVGSFHGTSTYLPADQVTEQNLKTLAARATPTNRGRRPLIPAWVYKKKLQTLAKANVKGHIRLTASGATTVISHQRKSTPRRAASDLPPVHPYKPGSSMLTVRSGGGSMYATKTGDTLVINDVEVPESNRGQGHGMRMYEAMALHAEASGLELNSDVTVEPEAVRAWEGLARRGFNVRTRETAQRNPDGLVFGKGDTSPLFIPRRLSKASKSELGPQRPRMNATHPAGPGRMVEYTCKKTGTKRKGQVYRSGAVGCTVIDSETGATVKVPHGHYAAVSADSKE